MLAELCKVLWVGRALVACPGYWCHCLTLAYACQPPHKPLQKHPVIYHHFKPHTLWICTVPGEFIRNPVQTHMEKKVKHGGRKSLQRPPWSSSQGGKCHMWVGPRKSRFRLGCTWNGTGLIMALLIGVCCLSNSFRHAFSLEANCPPFQLRH